MKTLTISLLLLLVALSVVVRAAEVPVIDPDYVETSFTYTTVVPVNPGDVKTQKQLDWLDQHHLIVVSNMSDTGDQIDAIRPGNLMEETDWSGIPKVRECRNKILIIYVLVEKTKTIRVPKCPGREGKTGPMGPQGCMGPQGPAGPPGLVRFVLTQPTKIRLNGGTREFYVSPGFFNLSLGAQLLVNPPKTNISQSQQQQQQQQTGPIDIDNHTQITDQDTITVHGGDTNIGISNSLAGSVVAN